jgi:hypothetical protein
MPDMVLSTQSSVIQTGRKQVEWMNYQNKVPIITYPNLIPCQFLGSRYASKFFAKNLYHDKIQRGETF